MDSLTTAAGTLCFLVNYRRRRAEPSWKMNCPPAKVEIITWTGAESSSKFELWNLKRTISLSWLPNSRIRLERKWL
jgi:hypothetical protein